MDTSLLYHAFGVREQDHIATHYAEGGIIEEIITKKTKIHCPNCGNKDVTRAGVEVREYRSLPIGGKPTTFRVRVQRVHCEKCGVTRQEKLHFVTGKRKYTNALARYVVELSRMGTIKEVARHLRMSWNTVKDIQKEYLQKNYSHPSLKGLRIIGIDEFAVKKGHVYKTIVINMETGQVVYVGDGKGADALDGFWRRLKRAGCRIEAVCTDLSAAYISAVREHLPEAVHVYDHFHVMKLMTDTLDKIRVDTYKSLEDEDKRKAVKGMRWVLLRNQESLGDDTATRQRLQQALSVNQPLATAYYLKEKLRLLWSHADKGSASLYLDTWLHEARASGVRRLAKVAESLDRHRQGILAWYDYRITNGRIEGINNKIKTLKRQAYGYRDMEFFELKILSLHDKNYAFL